MTEAEHVSIVSRELVWRLLSDICDVSNKATDLLIDNQSMS